MLNSCWWCLKSIAASCCDAEEDRLRWACAALVSLEYRSGDYFNVSLIGILSCAHFGETYVTQVVPQQWK